MRASIIDYYYIDVLSTDKLFSLTRNSYKCLFFSENILFLVAIKIKNDKERHLINMHIIKDYDFQYTFTAIVRLVCTIK